MAMTPSNDGPDDITPEISKERSPYRNYRSGYTDRHRKVSDEELAKNWERTFGKKRTQERAE
jgi:hypothetical protein